MEALLKIVSVSGGLLIGLVMIAIPTLIPDLPSASDENPGGVAMTELPLTPPPIPELDAIPDSIVCEVEELLISLEEFGVSPADTIPEVHALDRWVAQRDLLAKKLLVIEHVSLSQWQPDNGKPFVIGDAFPEFKDPLSVRERPLVRPINIRMRMSP